MLMAQVLPPLLDQAASSRVSTPADLYLALYFPPPSVRYQMASLSNRATSSASVTHNVV
jgi:hypothetical protein